MKKENKAGRNERKEPASKDVNAYPVTPDEAFKTEDKEAKDFKEDILVILNESTNIREFLDKTLKMFEKEEIVETFRELVYCVLASRNNDMSLYKGLVTMLANDIVRKKLFMDMMREKDGEENSH